jgi:hypothetical protein
MGTENDATLDREVCRTKIACLHSKCFVQIHMANVAATSRRVGQTDLCVEVCA